MAVIRRLRLRAKQVMYFVLSGTCGFDSWHYRIVRENCRYFEGVRALHRALKPAATVEVGCGLGEIISGLESRIRVGLDRDVAVIRAARLLRGRAVTFLHVSEFDRTEVLLRRSSGTCLLFLNWFHAYQPDELRRIAREYVERAHATHVLFDVINESTEGYRFRHSPDVLRGVGSVIAIKDAGDGIRRLVALQVGMERTPGDVTA